MNTTSLSQFLTVKLQRRTRASELDTIADRLEKSKKGAKTHGQSMACYYWNESEIELVINELN